VAFFQRVGGYDVNKNVFNILRALLAHDLAIKLRFTDQTKKVAFGSLKIAAAVRGESVDFDVNKVPSVLL
jgi:hypothetical protein